MNTQGGYCGNQPFRSIQRWRARHHHHHHGNGFESARGHGLVGVAPHFARCPQLCAQLRVCGHLLEQPPPPVSIGAKNLRFGVVGQFVFVVLVVAVSHHHRLVGRPPTCQRAEHVVRHGVADGSHQFLRIGTTHHRSRP